MLPLLNLLRDLIVCCAVGTFLAGVTGAILADWMERR